MEKEIKNFKKTRSKQINNNAISEKNLNSYFDYFEEEEIEEETNLIDYDVLNIKLLYNEDIKNINSDIQKLYYYLIIEKIINFDFPVYLPHFIDFRGRMYSNSSMGFTNLKSIRAFFKLKGLRDDLKIRNSLYFKKINDENIILNENFSIHIKNDIDKYFLTILLLELGKINKNKIAKCEGNTLNEFVELGTYLYFNSDKFKLEDLSYYLKIKACIDNFLINKM